MNPSLLRHPDALGAAPSTEDGLSGLPGIDVKNGLFVMGGNASLYARMLKKFSESTLYDDLLAAIERGSASDIQSQSHALKGVAANLSLRPLLELVTEIEQEAKAGSSIACDDPRLNVLKETYHTARQSAAAAGENPETLKTEN